MSIALFNALVLVSRLSNGFFGPLIASRVEDALARGGGAGLRTLRDAARMPRLETLAASRRPLEVSWAILFANALAQAILVVGVLALIYAGYIVPEYRVTASQLSALIKGFATIMLFLVIDPQLSVLTDDVFDGKMSEPAFRRAIMWICSSLLVGTLGARLIVVPAALAIAWAANLF